METFSVLDAFKALDDVKDSVYDKAAAVKAQPAKKLEESVKSSADDPKDSLKARIASFLREKTKFMQDNPDCTLSHLDLDDDFVVAVYWSEGFDSGDASVIHAGDDASYGLVAAVKLGNPDEYDGAYLEYPSDEEGPMTDEYDIAPDCDFDGLASELADDYTRVLDSKDITNLKKSQAKPTAEQYADGDAESGERKDGISESFKAAKACPVVKAASMAAAVAPVSGNGHMAEAYASETVNYRYTVNGNDYIFKCTSQGTSYGFRHLASLMDSEYEELGSAHASYYNRTWETYRFQSVMLSAVDSAMAHMNDKNSRMKDMKALKDILSKDEYVSGVEESYDVKKSKTCRTGNGHMSRAMKITESEKTDVSDPKAVKKMDDDSRKDDSTEVEKVIDVDADTDADLQKSYVGDVILQCPTCHTLVYKKTDEVEQSEASDDDSEDSDKKELVNVGEECPHCGSKDGFTVIGKVAPISSDDSDSADSKDPDGDADSTEPAEEKDDNAGGDDTEGKSDDGDDSDVSDGKEESLTIGSVDDAAFDALVERYLDNVYDNVKSYKSDKGSVSHDGHAICLEGLITFNSGKTLRTKFMLENLGQTKRGNVRLVGMNETFSKAKHAFQVIGKVKDDAFLSESFIYSYTARRDDKPRRIYGRVLGSN